MFFLLILHLIAFSVPPLYFTSLYGPLRRVHFYVYLSILLLVGGFMGNVYSLPVAQGMTISGGNLCYGAFMMTSVMFVWIERDAFILRHLVRLVILVDIFNLVLSLLTETLLETEGVINPHNVPADMFELSTPMIALGGALIVLELLLLLFIFEFTKKRELSLSITAVVYMLSFILVLLVDGILFPVVAFGLNEQIVGIVIGGLRGKIFMAAAFSVPLAFFMLWRRQEFIKYLESDTFRWRLLLSSSTELIKEMASAKKEIGLLSRQLVEIQETEHQRIAAELHDTTAQHLVGASLNISAALNNLESIGRESRFLNDAKNSVQLALNELRTFSFLLHPRELSNREFSADLAEFVSGFSTRAGLRQETIVGNEIDKLHHDAHHLILRLVQSALANVHQHAKASKVKVEVRVKGSKLQLSIVDDGQSRRGQQIDFVDGVGLASMRRRVSPAGGRIEINATEEGTAVVIGIPL